MKQSVTLRRYIDTHRIFSQLFLFTLRHKLFKWIISKPAVFTYCVSIWSFGRDQSSKCTLLVSFRARRTHTRAHTHTHTRAQTHTHFSLGNSISRANCTFKVLLSNMSSNLENCKDGILQQSTNDLSDSDVKFWSERNECAPLWREGSCARSNAAIILRSQKKETINKLSLI